MKRNTSSALVLSGLILSSQGLLTAPVKAETELNLSTGIDSNPYRFSDTYKDDLALYFDNRLKYTYETEGGFFIGVNLHSISFNDAFDAANRKRHFFEVGYDHKFNDSHRLKGTFRQGEYNKTYVSRLTGAPATVGGESIADRYDHGWSDIQLDYTFKLNKQHRLYAEFDFTKRNYVDFTELGISDLDYDQIGYSLAWRFKPNKDWTTRLEIEGKNREYVNKPNRDELGNTVEGDPLAYLYQRVNAYVRYQISESHELKVSVLSETRDDEFQAYYNTDYSRYAVEWSWNFEDYGTMVTEFKSRVLESTNQLSEEEQEDEFSGYDYDGLAVTVSYLYDIWEKDDIKIDGYVSLTHSDFDAVRPEYIYTRQQLEVGVNIEL